MTIQRNQMNIAGGKSLTQPGKSEIQSAILAASHKTGVNFSYLMQKASIESDCNATAKCKTSSAEGLYQFVDQTWLQMVHNHGNECGLSGFASKIHKTSDGKYVVANPADKKEILNLKKNPQLSAFMAAKYSQENKAYLKAKLHRNVTDTDLYFCHLLGPNGAVRFLKAMKDSSGQSAAAQFPKASQTNYRLFHDNQGREKSLGAIYAGIQKKFTHNQSTQAQTASLKTPSLSTLPHQLADATYTPKQKSAVNMRLKPAYSSLQAQEMKDLRTLGEASLRAAENIVEKFYPEIMRLNVLSLRTK